jgi:hypothetical protein
MELIMTTPNNPIVNAGLLYVNGLGISKTAAKQITMQLGAARDSTNTNDIILGTTASVPVAAPIVINGATVGANGVDVAAIILNKFYAVYLIGDSTDHNASAGLLSLNATTPSLPSGYDMYRRVGWILTDGSANILLFWQYANGNSRTYYYDVGISELSGGTSTSYAPVDLSTAVPPIATEVLALITFTANGATDIAHFLPFGSTATNGIVEFGYGVAAAQVGMATIPCQLNAAAPTIQYKVTSGSDALTVLVAGYKDLL